jgi:hypothetical protein
MRNLSRLLTNRQIFLLATILVIILSVPSMMCAQMTQQNETPGKTAILFNPLGVLQFGPIFQGEFAIAPNLYLTTHVRFAAFGVVYQAIESDGFEDDVSFGSMAVGGGMKFLMKTPYSPNCFYIGGFAEYGWGATENTEVSRPWKGNDAYFSFISNFGYRWRFPSKFFLNIGVIAGLAPVLKDEWYYVDDPSTIIETDEALWYVAMLELSMGWEF